MTNSIKSSLSTLTVSTINSIPKVKKISSESAVRIEKLVSKNEKHTYQEKIEYDKLTNKITEVYSECFGVIPDLTPLQMLEKLENALEEFYENADNVSTEFMTEHQTMINKERREQQRIASQAAKEKAQQEKKEHAIARATKPINKRYGRPVISRAVPIKHEKNIDEERLRILEEMRKEEEMLFGPLE